MNLYWLIWIVPLGLILLVLLIVFLRLAFAGFYRYAVSRNCLDTEMYIRYNLGLVIYLDGNIGVGKTTMGAGITNMRTRQYMIDAQLKIQEIQQILYYIDFGFIDNIIAFAFTQMKITNTDFIIGIILDPSNLPKELIRSFDIPEDPSLLFKGNYNDYFVSRSKINLLRQYVDATLALLRNNYVYFVFRKFYSRITNNYSMPFYDHLYDLKVAFEKKDFSIFRYTVIYKDEKALDKSNIKTNELKKSDLGGDMFLRLIRQMGFETITYITTIQDFERDVKFEREISTSILRVYKRDEIVCFKMAISLYQKAIRFIDFCLNLKVRFARKKNRLKASRKQSKLKLLRFKFLSRINYLRSSGFIRYRGIQYSKASEVGKKPEDCLAPAGEFDLIFPIQWCYGSVDSYAYSIVYDYLSLQSINHNVFEDVIDSDIDEEKRLKEIYDYLDSILKREIKTRSSFSLNSTVSDDDSDII